MFSPASSPGSRIQKLSSLYEDGSLLEQHETREGPIASELRVAQESWASMRVADPLLQGFARNLADNDVGRYWRYVRTRHLPTEQQQGRLAKFRGEAS